MHEISRFYEVVQNPGAYAAEWKKKTGGKVVGHFCSYTPEEMITAAGALPFRILGRAGNISKADGHLQAYSCSLVRGALEDALQGRLDFIDGTVFPHTCDSIQRLSDIWRLNIPAGFHVDVVMPVKLNTDTAREYMVAVVDRFREDLESGLNVSISEEKLAEAVEIHNGIRNSLSILYDIRKNNPGAITGSQIHTIFKAAMVMDRLELSQQLAELVAALQKKTAEPKPGAKRIVLSGGLCSMPDIYEVIEGSGGVVVWDDFCTGSRYFEGEIPGDKSGIDAIADRYLSRVVCPAKHSGIRSRGEHLIETVRRHQANGVIFLLLKFCDPHAFDYPYMKEMLEKEGIPCMLVELEDNLASEGQLRTRCEAFIEMMP